MRGVGCGQAGLSETKRYTRHIPKTAPPCKKHTHKKAHPHIRTQTHAQTHTHARAHAVHMVQCTKCTTGIYRRLPHRARKLAKDQPRTNKMYQRDKIIQTLQSWNGDID